jgi:hypothetical protein
MIGPVADSADHDGSLNTRERTDGRSDALWVA